MFFSSQDLVYDLGDASKWEFMFSTTDKPLLMIPVDEADPLDIDDEEVLYSVYGGKRDSQTKYIFGLLGVVKVLKDGNKNMNCFI